MADIKDIRGLLKEAYKKKIKPITIDGVGVLHLRPMSALLRVDIAEEIRKREGREEQSGVMRLNLELACRLIRECLADEYGARVFAAETTVEAICDEIDADMIGLIANEIFRNVRDSDASAEKNLLPSPSGDSPTA